MERDAQDAEIIQCVIALQKGDAIQVDRLIALFQDRLFRFCVFLTASRDGAEDLCQEAFIKILRSIAKLKEPKRFISWSFMIARNLLADSHRPARSREEPRPLLEEDLERMIAGDVAPSELSELVHIQNSIKSLDYDDRILIILLHIEGHSLKEVSEITGLSETQVGAKAFWARKRLKKKLDAI